MANKTWRIDVEGQQHVIEVQTGSLPEAENLNA